MKDAAVTLGAISQPRSLAADYLALIRPRIGGHDPGHGPDGRIAGFDSAIPSATLLHAVFATGLVTAAASVLNQWIERHSDAQMQRHGQPPAASRPADGPRSLRHGPDAGR